jgi:acylphosphatase
LHVIVEGRVQGVGFRYFVAETAQELGVVGWVRNRWDESVEVLAEGEPLQLEKLLAALRRGPRAAFVATVAETWLAATGEFASFHVRPTA